MNKHFFLQQSRKTMVEHSVVRYSLIFPEEGRNMDGISTPTTFKKLVCRRTPPTYFDACEEYMMDLPMYTDPERQHPVNFREELPMDATIYVFFPDDGNYSLPPSDRKLFWEHVKACEEKVVSEQGHSGNLSNLVIARYELDKIASAEQQQ